MLFVTSGVTLVTNVRYTVGGKRHYMTVIPTLWVSL